jgi:hypothetical protein
MWGISQDEVVDTATKFFNEKKALEKVCSKNKDNMLKLQVRVVLSE